MREAGIALYNKSYADVIDLAISGEHADGLGSAEWLDMRAMRPCGGAYFLRNALIQPPGRLAAMLCHPPFKTVTIRGQPSLAILAFLCIVTSSSVHADEPVHLAQYGYPNQRNEFKEKFRSGPCEDEREQKSDGKYKQERKCGGARVATSGRRSTATGLQGRA